MFARVRQDDDDHFASVFGTFGEAATPQVLPARMPSSCFRVNRMPRAAATNSNAIPALVLVGSTSSVSGPSNSRLSASQIIAALIRQLTE